jgi:Hydrazine synthase alpha subunit middle domain
MGFARVSLCFRYEMAGFWGKVGGVSWGFMRGVVVWLALQLGGAAVAAAGVPEPQLRDWLLQDKVSPPPGDARWLERYVKACEERRQQRLTNLLAKAPRIVFTKHRTIRPSFFAYTEGQSDAQNERHFLPDSELCLLEMDGLYGKVRSLVSDPTGAIRDPAVSWDGQRVLFAWKKSLNEDDYHLYEFNVVSNTVRQITSGAGFADYEPAYLPNGDIIFASTRCVQTVDCFWTEVSNLYTCDRDGRYLRRLGFDQAHTLYPQVLGDGRVIYTRWDYNDRGQIFPQPLFQMNPDGTGQSEFYGNNAWFPTTIAHARGIPGTQKVLAILCGHHTPQAGKLAVIDPARGRQEADGVQLVAPIRATPAEHTDAYGQQGELWQYPYPLNEQECLVTYAPLGWDQPAARRGDADFGIYWMDMAGHRELLAWDPRLPCSQPVPLAPRPRPLLWANRVDYNLPSGTFYMQDIYVGPGLAGVPRGTIRKLRVVTLDFRAAGIGFNGNDGPGGGAMSSTPISIGNGAWDVKVVLGEAKVYEDGSALFTAPARKPLYFQALDERGRAVQTMRSWSTLQPGEYAACVGCHEHKNTAPPAATQGFSLAMKAGPQALEPFYGPPRGFSFAQEVQPILDRHCIRCHKDRQPIQALVRAQAPRPLLSEPLPRSTQGDGKQDALAFSLLGETTVDPTPKRKWSDAYLLLTQAYAPAPGEPLKGQCQGRVVNWISAQSVPAMLPPYSAGAAKSELLTLLDQGHKGVKLSREELDKLACWIDLLVPYCGDYREANAWTEEEMKKYERYAEKRRAMEELEQQNIDAMLGRNEPARRRGPGMGMMPRGY